MRIEVAKLEERMMNFAVEIVLLTNDMGGTYAGRHIAGQLLRSGTSSSSNYDEACVAQSRADFIH